METSPRRLVPRHLGGARPKADSSPVKVEREGSESRLRIEGAFDALTVRDISPAIERLLAEGPTRVTVDLGQVPMMDSRGVSAIVSLWKRMNALGGQVVVVHAHDQPLAVLKVLKLDALFRM